ncbi:MULTISPECIES: hypothetical protein [unclassified Agrococcus]|uniref:hypothetical protein n=1 Tax=unclassified Agrococcus TaxID=2615065 RepID=UPI00361BB9C8
MRHDETSERRRGPTDGVRVLDWAVRLCLLTVAAVLVMGMLGFVLVRADRVVPGWAVGAVLLVATISLAVVRMLVRRHARDVEGAGPGGRRRPWWIVAAAALGVVAGVGSVADLPATYTVLTPGGPGACQLAVREHSFLFDGGGEVYVAGPGGVAMQVGSWTADDGGQPVASGSYALRWNGDDALLSLSSDPGNPVWPSELAVSCP